MRRLALLPLLGLMLAGCGGPEVTFWLVVADPSPDPVCVPASTTMPNQTDTQTGFLSSSTWELYPGGKDASGKDTIVLQLSAQGSNAISGTKDGNKFTFTGVDTRVTKSPNAMNPTETDTDTTTTTITFTVDGSTLSGTATQAINHACTGTACPMPTNPPPCSTSSTTTTTFRGSRVDAEIKHDV
ncbi:MAG: hypothetical protein QM723_35970 [Myxococcaceae bacterium]